MVIDLLVAEIGSTTTVLNAFDNLDGDPKFIGQGQGSTSVYEGDVLIGINEAIKTLEESVGEKIEYRDFIATSSAAGGLKMTVHGLVHDMTVRAAKEAALGAGANLKFLTSGKLRATDLKKIEEIKPNIILLAGGVDYGERDTAIHNAEMIKSLNLSVPLIYAGNIENQEEIREIFKDTNIDLYITENVYPEIDNLNVEPTREIIQKVFEKHIIHAPGMEKVRDMVSGTIMPTPGAVISAAELLYDDIGGLMVIDVGGATTDVHSVCDDSEKYSLMALNPEPKSKRTVEGDLGMYVSRHHVYDMMDKESFANRFNIELEELDREIDELIPIPETKEQIKIVEELAKFATQTAVKRHAGYLRVIFGVKGKKIYAVGKDLTNVRWIIGTGGALTRLPNRENIIGSIFELKNKSEFLLPNDDAKFLYDNDYIMASLGCMAVNYPEAALKLLKKSLKIEE